MLTNITNSVIFWDCTKSARDPSSPDKIFESVEYGFSGYEGIVVITDELHRFIKTHGGVIRLHNSENRGYSHPLTVVNDTMSNYEPTKRYGINPLFSIEFGNKEPNGHLKVKMIL